MSGTCSKKLDLLGHTFGRLTVIGEVGKNKFGRTLWKCSCRCGGQKVIATQFLRSGESQSCGCFRKETAAATGKRNKKHRSIGTVEYQTWGRIIQRCHNSKNKDYKHYGGRGIKVCDRWMKSFDMFLQDMGHRPLNMTSIDRIDNNGNYEPNNCRWANNKTQHNNSRNNRCFEFQGRTQTIAQWARDFGIKQCTLAHRIRKG